MKKIGLIGIGLVGTAMAESLLARKFDVIGFDIDPQRCAEFEKLGGKFASSPVETARQVEHVIFSLPDTQVVQHVVEDPNGILEANPLPKYIIDTTTGDPQETLALAERLKQQSINMLDSTISGSSQQVRDRVAVFMVGGDKAAFEKCNDIFKILSDRVFYIGPSGHGSKAKLASNLILGLNRLVLAEGLVFAEKLGLDPAKFLEVAKGSASQSQVMDIKGPKMVSGDFTPQGYVHQSLKDTKLMLAQANAHGQRLSMLEIYSGMMQACVDAGEAELDNAAVINEVRRRTVAGR